MKAEALVAIVPGLLRAKNTSSFSGVRSPSIWRLLRNAPSIASKMPHHPSKALFLSATSCAEGDSLRDDWLILGTGTAFAEASGCGGDATLGGGFSGMRPTHCISGEPIMLSKDMILMGPSCREKSKMDVGRCAANPGDMKLGLETKKSSARARFIDEPGSDIAAQFPSEKTMSEKDRRKELSLEKAIIKLPTNPTPFEPKIA